MKALVCIAVFAAIVMTNSFVLSQTGFWDKSQRVTSGYIDKNPSFDVKRTINYGLSYISFLVFERRTLIDNSNICVIKFGYDSAYGGVKYITNDNNIINRNPQIAYKHTTVPDSIQNAMIVWEKVENSRVNIYGSTYFNRIWSAPYPIDTGAGIKSSPHLSYNSALSGNYLYSVVYERDGDIIFKNYESILNQVWNDINLTDSIADVCRNPNVSAMVNYNQPIFVVYERQKANGDYALYYKKSGTSYIFTGDTVALRGNNRNANFLNGIGGISVSYESNFSGKWGIYEYVYGGSQANTLLQSGLFNYRNLKNFLYPIITNGPMTYYSLLTSYIIQRPAVTKILSTIQLGLLMDSITIGDSSSKSVLTLGNGLTKMTNTLRVWMVYDKDSAGFSTLDARGKLIVISNVNRIGTEVPGSYSLGQNYPNPFNAISKIKYKISKSSNVKIDVMDILGKNVMSLVNEIHIPGIYETSFDGSMLNSGVYFIRMLAYSSDGSGQVFKETKRMTLIK